MINFICSSLGCIQMYLGPGTVLVETRNQVIYYNFDKIYVCTRSSYFFSCRNINRLFK